MKGFLLKRQLSHRQRETLTRKGCPSALVELLQNGIPAISLVSGVAFSTAFGNDVDGTYVFAQQVHVLGKAGDVLIAISTSGNFYSVISHVESFK